MPFGPPKILVDITGDTAEGTSPFGPKGPSALVSLLKEALALAQHSIFDGVSSSPRCRTGTGTHPPHPPGEGKSLSQSEGEGSLALTLCALPTASKVQPVSGTNSVQPPVGSPPAGNLPKVVAVAFRDVLQPTQKHQFGIQGSSALPPSASSNSLPQKPSLNQFYGNKGSSALPLSASSNSLPQRQSQNLSEILKKVSPRRSDQTVPGLPSALAPDLYPAAAPLVRVIPDLSIAAGPTVPNVLLQQSAHPDNQYHGCFREGFFCHFPLASNFQTRTFKRIKWNGD